MLIMIRVITVIVRILFCVVCGGFGVYMLTFPNPSPHMIGMTMGIMLILIANMNFIVEKLNRQTLNKSDLKIVETQNLILNEITQNNLQVISFITAQSEALQKMTAIAVKK